MEIDNTCLYIDKCDDEITNLDVVLNKTKFTSSFWYEKRKETFLHARIYSLASMLFFIFRIKLLSYFFATSMTLSGYGYLFFDNTQSNGKCGLSISCKKYFVGLA